MRTLVAATIVSAAAQVYAQAYDFSIISSRSGLIGSAEVSLWTKGTLAGTYDALSNPNGTQTKPSLNGVFDPGENKPVQCEPLFVFTGMVNTTTTGTFTLDVNIANQTATVSHYVCNKISNGPVTLAAKATLNNRSFRTQQPAGSFVAGFPSLDLGTTTMDKFQITQLNVPRTGTLTPLGGNRYKVSVTFMANADVNITEMGQQHAMRFLVPYSLVGTLVINGGTADFGLGNGVGGESIFKDQGVQLEPVLMGLPASNNIATTNLNLTVESLGIDLYGNRSFQARGVVRA